MPKSVDNIVSNVDNMQYVVQIHAKRNNMARKEAPPTIKQAVEDRNRLIKIAIFDAEIEQEQLKDKIIRRGGRV